MGDFAVYPQGTNISNAPLSEDFLKTANLGLYLGYTKGVLDVSYDSFLNPITTSNHLYIQENGEIINSVIYQFLQ